MTSYRHEQIAQDINTLEATPETERAGLHWLSAEAHLNILRQNAGEDEVILFAISPTTFIHAVITRESDITPLGHEELDDWSSSPYTKRASYCWTMGTAPPQIEFDQNLRHSGTMKNAQNLIFGDQLEGTNEQFQYELLQEFAHATGILWRDEQRAYCCLDENGDFDPVVSITNPDDDTKATLITCKRETLEQYMAATGSVLVRFFDFTMTRKNKFHGWGKGIAERKTGQNNLFYKQLITSEGDAYTTGNQLLHITASKEELFQSFNETCSQRTRHEPVTFIVKDWRNGTVKKASIDPAHPSYDLSPAFFRADVLLKYKTDRDKYTIKEENRSISCRGAWHLKSYSVNDAGQIHAYLCDLRALPYQEQLYWQSYNEEPKGDISKRAFENDFLGVWGSEETPLERILHKLRQWKKQNITWWTIKDDALLTKINTPVSNSRDEWAQSFLDLSIAVIEKFQKKPIQALLRQENITFEKNDGTLTLLDKLIQSQSSANEGKAKLEGLKQAQLVRNKVQSHSRGTEAEEISRKALLGHDTYRKHFNHVCDKIADELEMIEEACKATQGK